MRTFIWGTLIAIVATFLGLSTLDTSRYYIFNPDDLHSLAKSAIAKHGDDMQSIVDYIVGELVKDPKIAPHINLDQEWIFNNAGGAMGGMYMIHCSMTEYLLIFGTAIGTEGHSGRHTADDHFHILKGTQYVYTPGRFEPEVYPPGSVNLMKKGVVTQYSCREACFALEYAKGWIPPMMPFGYADTFFSTLDFHTLWRTTVVTGGQIIGNLLKGKM